MSSWSWKAGLAGMAMLATMAYAVAQTPAGHDALHGQKSSGDQEPPPKLPQGDMQMPMQRGMMQKKMMQGHQGAHGEAGQHEKTMTQSGSASPPTATGQDAFGAIQEIVQILEADPATEWSKVNIAALREHLIDMNEVALRAVATERALGNGIAIAVTGEGRTLEAIKRMVPAHTSELVRLGWNAATDELSNGVLLTVTTSDPKQVRKLKALGFMGVMVQGGNHQPHHLMMARGELHVH